MKKIFAFAMCCCLMMACGKKSSNVFEQTVTSFVVNHLLYTGMWNHQFG